MAKHQECKEDGHALNGVMSTMSAIVLVMHLILNVSNANNNNNNNNNNDNNDNNNNNVFVGQLVAESEFDNDYGTMTIGMGKRSAPDFYEGIQDNDSTLDISALYW